MQNIDSRRPNTNTSLPSNLRMHNAERNSFHKLLKEELRMTIMAKRHARGQGEMKVEFPEPESHELTMAEIERRERRREQNRRAAQRCRKKKRMNQMSVLQNYEWIINRNQKLQLEVDQLRQEKSHLQTLLKTHRDACTCAHTQKTLLHALPTQPAVKTEPRENSPATSHVGYGTPPSTASQGSWQYGSAPSDSVLTSCSAGPAAHAQQQQQQQQQSYNSVRNYQSVSYTGLSFPATSCSTGSSSSYPAHNGLNSLTPVKNEQQRQIMTGESPNMQETVAHSHSQYNCSNIMNSVSTAACISPGQAHQHQVPAPITTGDHVTLLEELVCMPGGLSACAFQEEAATPLSADGRRSISSISSDVSAASDKAGNDVNMTSKLPVSFGAGDFGVTDDVVQHDFSHLLSQINQNDLLFPHDSSLDEVFSESAAAAMNSLPEHFLHNI